MSRSVRARLLVLVGSIVACSLPPIGPAAATDAGVAAPPTAAPPRVAAPPTAPRNYSLPKKKAIWVSNSRQLRVALARYSRRDIVLRSGVYDNAGPFLDPRGNHLYAQVRGTVVLKAGIGLGGITGPGGGLIRGIAFDIEDRAKTLGGAVVAVWGTGSNSAILDITLEGHGAIDTGILARQVEGLVIRRVVARDFRSYGLLVDTNVRDEVVQRPPVIESVTSSYVSWSPPGSSNGKAEACVWIGNTAVVRRVRAHHCAGEGVWVGMAASGALFEDIRVTDVGIGMYFEHFVRSSTFRRLQIGPGVRRGVTCEWADPAWSSQPACTDLLIEGSWFDTRVVGVYLDAGTMGTTVRSSTFLNQCWAGIGDFRGNNNLYDTTGNDYSRLQPGAVPISNGHYTSGVDCAASS